MASTIANYKIRKFPSTATLTVRIVATREYKLRAWIAKRLIWSAAWVLGCGIETKDAPYDVYRKTAERVYSLPWTTNDDSTMVSLPKTTWKEWLRELDELKDGE